MVCVDFYCISDLHPGSHLLIKLSHFYVFLKRGEIQRTKVMKSLLSQVIWPNSPRRVSSSTPIGSSLYLCGFLRFTLSYNLCAHIVKNNHILHLS